MKQIIILFLAFCSLQAAAQSNSLLMLDINNSAARINSNGMFFQDVANQMGYYRPHKLSQGNTIYQMSVSATAKDQNGQDRLSVTTYDDSDLTCGPVATNYSDPDYISKYGNKLWRVDYSEITQHKQNWNNAGYTVPDVIAKWPGNGDVSNGMAAKLAPYTDINGNGIYDPENGDYPDIMGDRAIYLIMNDKNNTKFPGTIPLNMEVHFMFYQYVSNAPLSWTTFLNVKVFNRSSETLTDMKWNILTDFDLGDYADDFGGTDLSRNMTYVYNGTNVDGNGQMGSFGANPPAMGMISLNHPLMTSIFPDSIPEPGQEFLNVINGKQADGTAITNNGSPTLFQFTDTLGTGYNEPALNNAPGERRSFSTVSLGTFAPNSVKCMDFVWVYGRKLTGTSLLKSVHDMMQVADFVQIYYNNTNHCVDGTLQIASIESAKMEIYPNPSEGKITCVSDQELELIEVWNMEGKLIRTVQTHEKEMTLDLSTLTAGVYLIKLSTGNETKTLPFYKQ
ncbi:hypothetical protein D3C87_97560 [compost metagenome]